MCLKKATKRPSTRLRPQKRAIQLDLRGRSLDLRGRSLDLRHDPSTCEADPSTCGCLLYRIPRLKTLQIQHQTRHQLDSLDLLNKKRRERVIEQNPRQQNPSSESSESRDHK